MNNTALRFTGILLEVGRNSLFDSRSTILIELANGSHIELLVTDKTAVRLAKHLYKTVSFEIMEPVFYGLEEVAE